ncbi:hypothetical protein RQP46_001103 [Phenoliferia psychrophenolica]
MNTTIDTVLGSKALQLSDFYELAGILHPVAIGSIAIVGFFIYLRLSSNRTIAPLSLFDVILNTALGSTLAGIVNGTPLARGVEALAVLASFQYGSSFLATQFPSIAVLFISSPLIIVFRGEELSHVMRRNRISRKDLNAALRTAKVWNVSECEAVIIEPTGKWSVYLMANFPKDCEPDVLYDVPGYRAMCDNAIAVGVSAAHSRSWNSEAEQIAAAAGIARLGSQGAIERRWKRMEEEGSSTG